MRLSTFIIALPVLVAFGIDLYLYSQNMEQGFMLSAPGYLWTKYAPENYKWAFATYKDYWPYINLVITQKTIIVAAAISFFLLVLRTILGLFTGPRYRGDDVASYANSGSRLDKIMGGGQTTFKYKRK